MKKKKMRKTEKHVKALCVLHQLKLINVKPYVILIPVNSLAGVLPGFERVLRVHHICKPARWSSTGAWSRSKFEGRIDKGKCSNCSRKLGTKFELVALMMQHKDKMVLSSSG